MVLNVLDESRVVKLCRVIAAGRQIAAGKKMMAGVILRLCGKFIFGILLASQPKIGAFLSTISLFSDPKTVNMTV